MSRKSTKSVKFTCDCGKTIRVAGRSECQRAGQCWACVEKLTVKERKDIYEDQD